MGKINFISADSFQLDIWKLAASIRDSGWKPDVLIGLWRGGATVAISVHEFLKVSGCPVEHIPLKCFSYTAIGKNEGEVKFAFADAVFNALKPGDKVLFVDDIFDTGKTAAAVKDAVAKLGIDMKFAAVYWKPEKNLTTLKPDFYAKAIDSSWVCFPHEIEGLTPEEIREKNPALAGLLKI